MRRASQSCFRAIEHMLYSFFKPIIFKSKAELRRNKCTVMVTLSITEFGKVFSNVVSTRREMAALDGAFII